MAKLLYFGALREKLGMGEETLDIPQRIETVQQLVGFLRERGDAFELAFENTLFLRAAINQEHAAFDTRISNTDEIAFFPPVTGG